MRGVLGLPVTHYVFWAAKVPKHMIEADGILGREIRHWDMENWSKITMIAVLFPHCSAMGNATYEVYF